MTPVVDQVVPARRGNAATVAGTLLLALTLGALGHVAVRLKNYEVAYELGRERNENERLEEQRRRLQIEIGMLKDPDRIVRLAREKLQMGPPAPDAIRPLAALHGGSGGAP